MFLQLLALSLIIDGKNQFNVGAVATPADHLFRCFSAQRDLDRTDDDRFSGSRLTGQNVESVPELHLRRIDQSQIFHS